jgi:hypothetical protein
MRDRLACEDPADYWPIEFAYIALELATIWPTAGAE